MAESGITTALWAQLIMHRGEVFAELHKGYCDAPECTNEPQEIFCNGVFHYLVCKDCANTIRMEIRYMLQAEITAMRNAGHK